MPVLARFIGLPERDKIDPVLKGTENPTRVGVFHRQQGQCMDVGYNIATAAI